MNNNPKTIHETAIKDILDIWDSIKSISTDKLKNGSSKGMMNSSSIAKASSNLTMVFPVLCSRGVSIEAASMVSKAIEKRCVSMLQMLFSSFQVSDPDVGIKNVQDYINQFHTNISTRAASLDDLFDLGFKESADVPYSIMEAIRQDNINNTDYYLPSSISESSLSVFTVKEGAVSSTASGNTSASKAGGTFADYNKNEMDKMKAAAEFLSKQVSDSEFKKANELMPTTMIVNFTLRDKDGNGNYVDTKVSDAVVGVKAKLYPIGSDDVINHLVDKTQSRNWITNFVRATTRETSFMKDFVLALDKAKIDAMSLSDRKSSSDKMWKVLERRATISRLKRALRMTNNASAITTLVISQDEVEYMRKNYNIDMEKLSNVVGLFESLNLLAFVIVDETLEAAKFIFDEQDPSWETISFTHLERESNDNTYKRVVNLMTKVAR